MEQTQAPIRTRQIVETDPFKQVNAANPFELAEQQLTEFIQSQIDRMKQSLVLGNNGNLSFDQVNTALMTYQDTLLALLALHSDAKMTYVKEKDMFESWFAEKYIIVRDELNPKTLSSQKWHSQKEIEMQIRTKYKKEYNELHVTMLTADHKLQFMRRLIEGWQAQQFALTQLSKNLIAEASSLGIENSLDKLPGNNPYGNTY